MDCLMAPNICSMECHYDINIMIISCKNVDMVHDAKIILMRNIFSSPPLCLDTTYNLFLKKNVLQKLLPKPT